MKKNTKRSLVFGLLGLFMIVFALQLVSADSFEDWFRSSFGEVYSSWQKGEVNPFVVKILFFLLVFVMVYTVAGNIPGLSSMFDQNATGFMKLSGFLFSGIISFLSLWAVKPEEVAAIMISYSALGYTLTSVVPLIILIFFTLNVGMKSPKSASQRLALKWMVAVMWIAYTLFSGWRFLMAWNNPEVSTGLALLFPLAGLIMLLALNVVFEWVRNEKLKSIMSTAKERSRLAKEREANLSKAEEDLGEGI